MALLPRIVKTSFSYKINWYKIWNIADYDDGLETTTFVSSDQANAFDTEIEEKSTRIPVSVCSTPCPIGEIKIQNEVRSDWYLH